MSEQYYPQPARDDLAFAMFAAWLNCSPDKVPLQFRAWTCPQTRAAWGRVAVACTEPTPTQIMDDPRVKSLVERLEVLRLEAWGYDHTFDTPFHARVHDELQDIITAIKEPQP